MFRHERPQKGRHRQFYQVGAELIGREDPLGDAELLLALCGRARRDRRARRDAAAELARRRARAGPRTAPRCASSARRTAPSCAPNCSRRLEKNPLRILDCKEPGCRAATASAPHLVDHLCAPCATHFARVRELLDAEGVSYELDCAWCAASTTTCAPPSRCSVAGLGAQSAIGGGGRYDGLVAQIGGPQVSGIGFAFGVERLVLALQACAPDIDAEIAAEMAPDLFIAPLGAAAEAAALTVARRLRQAGLRVELDGGRSLKSLMRRADKLKATQVMILGEEELAQRRATVA